MGAAISRSELQKLSDAKIADAALLFQHGRWSNSYYLAGYAVEMALKACAARQIVAESLPDRKFITSLYTHAFETLIGLAGLRGELREKLNIDTTFAAYWGIAAEWSPDFRYEAVDKSSASFLLHALQEPTHGVMQWIRTYW